MASVTIDQQNADISYDNKMQDKMNGNQTDASVSSMKNELNSQFTEDTSCPFLDMWPNSRNIWDAESPAHLQMDVSTLDQSLDTSDEYRRSSQQLEAKVDMVYSLLAILGGQEHTDMGKTLLSLSTNPDNCLAMRQSGCLPLLVQLVQSDRNQETRKKAAEALHNIVHSQPDEKLRKRESRILKILETVNTYTETLGNNVEFVCDNTSTQDGDKHPLQTVSQLMKYSFDEGYRQSICQLGGIHSIVKLIEAEHLFHGSITEDSNCNLLRRFSCMVLTNLTFGDSGNKALLCSYKDFIRALVKQLKSPNDELRQVTASIFRNLSWRTDSTSQEILKDVGSVKELMNAAMLPNKENTLISILSALWNLSAHSTHNKTDICSVEGALTFLLQMLTAESSAIVENSGGVLRNISSQISTNEDHRKILRENNCFEILLEQLKVPNLTVVSNACSILWNLSTQNAHDQGLLRTLGAASVLKNLTNSKHKVISMGASATLKNIMCLEKSYSTEIVETRASIEAVVPTRTSIEMVVPPRTLPIEAVVPTRTSIEAVVPTRTSPIVVSKKSSSVTSLPNFENNFDKFNTSKTSSNSGSTSLPHVNSRSNDDEFDFGARYSDAKKTTPVSTPNSTKENGSFSIYAETDLDQPTDYSLRYAEDDSDTDSEVCDAENAEKAPVSGFVIDTIKTYCTEGTPYETPFNFSTSTSMSDLGMNDKNESEREHQVKKEKNGETVANANKKECTPTSKSEPSQSGLSKPKSEFSSGLMSPEKPMNYCEEGTPGYFSRVSSFGSLNSPSCTNTDEMKTSDKRLSLKEEIIDRPKEEATTCETKMVKFENNISYCEETPLMFSRSSSLGSVDSAEHSIQDDRSSVISDFSRLTSGIISPSELPDSPTQTVSPSPKSQKKHDFSVSHRTNNNSRPASRRSLPKTSIFEDKLMKFKEENTPIQYSVATSLSSLTIDDRDENQLTEFEEARAAIQSNLTAELCQTQNEDVEMENYGATKGTKFNRSIGPAAPNFQGFLNSPLKTGEVSDPKRHEVEIPPLAVHNTLRTYCTEDTPALLSQNSSISDLSLSTLSMVDKEPLMNRVYLSENSSPTSEGDKIITMDETTSSNAQKVRNDWENKNCASGFDSMVNRGCLEMPRAPSVFDEVTSFAVEDSPMQFSLRSSLSNLTFESSKNMSPKNPASPQLEHVNEGASSNENVSSPQNHVEETEEDIESRSENRTIIEAHETEENNATNDDIINHQMNADKILPYMDTNSTLSEETASSLGSSNLYGSLKLRKWRWKWKFNSEGVERNANDISSDENPKIDPYAASNLDASYKKKKWWKWKFSTKEAEQSVAMTSTNEFHDNKSDKSKNSMYYQDKAESPIFGRAEEYQTTNKSKKWKWKWKFNSKEEKSEKTDGLSKSKFGESFKEPSRSSRESRATKSLPKRLSRSISEPRRPHKQEEYVENLAETPSSHSTNSTVEIIEHDNLSSEKEILNAEVVDVDEQFVNETVLNENLNKFLLNSAEKNIDSEMARNVVSNSAMNTERKNDNESCAKFINKSPEDEQRIRTDENVREGVKLGAISKSNFEEINKKTSIIDKTTALATRGDILNMSSNEPLDPVTISIIKRVLQRRFSKGEDVDKIIKDIDMKVTEFNGNNDPKDCNFEIVLEERIKVTLAKNGESGNEGETIRCKKSSFQKLSSQESDISQRLENQRNVDQKMKPEENPAKSMSPKVDKSADYASLIEECIQLGINKKKEIPDEAIYANVSLSPGYSRSNSRHDMKDTSFKSLPMRTKAMACPKSSDLQNSATMKPLNSPNCSNVKRIVGENGCASSKNPDYSALLEECIQLGMPKKTEQMRKELEVRTSLPNIDTSTSCVRTRAADLSTSTTNNKKDYMTLVEECIQFGMPKRKEESEEAIYANVSTTTRYSNNGSMKRLKDTTSKSTSCLPEKTAIMNAPKDVINTRTNYYSLNKVDNSLMKGTESLDRKMDHEFLIQECIQLGMPKRRETSEETLFTNNIQKSTFKTQACSAMARSSTKKMTRSDTETNPNRNIPDNLSVTRNGFSSSSTNRTALDECIQLGWPKKRETGFSKSIDSTFINSESSRFVPLEASRETESKNVDVASVARNILETPRECYKTTTATGAENEYRNVVNNTERRGIIKPLLTVPKRNGFN